jgi:hypothetical protein
MTYLIDTNVLSELRKGARCDANVARWATATPVEALNKYERERHGLGAWLYAVAARVRPCPVPAEDGDRTDGGSGIVRICRSGEFPARCGAVMEYGHARHLGGPCRTISSPLPQRCGWLAQCAFPVL